MSTTLLPPPRTDGGAPEPPRLDPQGLTEPKPCRRWVGYPAGLKARLVYSFSGESNDIIEMNRPSQGPDDFGNLLYNEIGAKQGDTRLYASSGRHYLDVEGDSWTVQVQGFQ